MVISFGSRTNFGLTLETNVALTVENRLACVPLGSVFNIRCRGRTQTHKEKGRVQVLVVLPRVFQIKLSRFPTVHGVEAGTRVTGPQRIEGSFGDYRRCCYQTRSAHLSGPNRTVTGSLYKHGAAKHSALIPFGFYCANYLFNVYYAGVLYWRPSESTLTRREWSMQYNESNNPASSSFVLERFLGPVEDAVSSVQKT